MPDPRQRTAESELSHTELSITALQTFVAAAFVIGSYAGMFDVSGTSRTVAVVWLIVYHVVQDAYAVCYRVRGRTLGWVEPLIPIGDLSCATLVYVAVGDPHSPIWAIYLYALMGYARRYHGRTYVVVATYTIGNLAAGWLAMGEGIDAEFAVMMIMPAAVAALSYTIGEAWRGAEERARILAETDPLTGIANRRTFLSKLAVFAANPVATFSVLMLDLDNFKRLNDEFGHQHGDEVLVACADAVAKTLEAGDVFGRYGGEEFIIALPETTLEEAAALGMRIRNMVAAARQRRSQSAAPNALPANRRRASSAAPTSYCCLPSEGDATAFSPRLAGRWRRRSGFDDQPVEAPETRHGLPHVFLWRQAESRQPVEQGVHSDLRLQARQRRAEAVPPAAAECQVVDVLPRNVKVCGSLCRLGS